MKTEGVWLVLIINKEEKKLLIPGVGRTKEEAIKRAQETLSKDIDYLAIDVTGKKVISEILLWLVTQDIIGAEAQKLLRALRNVFNKARQESLKLHGHKLSEGVD